MNRPLLLSLAVALAAAPAVARPAERNDSAQMMRQLGAPVLNGEKLEREIADAETHPLGSKDNPVRVDGPRGERAYLAQLVCENGSAPQIGTRVNVGEGRYGTILDVYPLKCDDDGPVASIHMDMYFRGTEDRAPPGFSIGGTPAPVKPTPDDVPAAPLTPVA